LVFLIRNEIFMSTSTKQKADNTKTWWLKWLAVFLVGLLFLPIVFLAFLGYISWFDTDQSYIKQALQDRFFQSTGQNLQLDDSVEIVVSSPSLSTAAVSVVDGDGKPLITSKNIRLTADSLNRLNFSIDQADTAKGSIQDIQYQLIVASGSLKQQGQMTFAKLDPLAFYQQLPLEKLDLPSITIPENRKALTTITGSLSYQLAKGLLKVDLANFKIDNTKIDGHISYDLVTGGSEIFLKADVIDVTDYVALAALLKPSSEQEQETENPMQLLAGLKAKGKIEISQLKYQQQTYESVQLEFE